MDKNLVKIRSQAKSLSKAISHVWLAIFIFSFFLQDQFKYFLRELNASISRLLVAIINQRVGSWVKKIHIFCRIVIFLQKIYTWPLGKEFTINLVSTLTFGNFSYKRFLINYYDTDHE